MAKCLVTGGAGFIGSNLVDELIRQGNEVAVIDDLSTGKREYLNPAAKFHEAEIGGPDIAKIFNAEKPEIVYHLAAQIDVRISVEDPVLDNKINVLGGLNVLQNARRLDVKKFVFSSTGGAIYGDAEEIPTSERYIPMPVSPYGIHKLTFEKYLNFYYQVYSLPYIVLRFSNVYGPRQYKGGEAGVVSIFIDHAVNGRECMINGDGRQTRDYIYVGDIVAALIAGGGSHYVGVLNISGGEETDLLAVVEEIEAAYGQKIEVRHAPAKAGEQRRSCLDFEKARKILEWEPRTKLREGIAKTIEWSRAQH